MSETAATSADLSHAKEKAEHTPGGPVVETPHEAGGSKHAHPSEMDYIKIFFILLLITAAEVAVYYVEMLEGALPFILITMSVVKFALVVLWFMHLRFDSRLFRRLFFTGLALAGFCFGIVLTTFHVWTR